MASNFKKSETILIPFRDGWSITDSQGKPRMYKTRKAFEKSFPRHYRGTDGVELEEYALVHHGRWINRGDYVTTAYGSLDIKVCSVCNAEVTIDHYDDYCPHCGAMMDLEV